MPAEEKLDTIAHEMSDYFADDNATWEPRYFRTYLERAYSLGAAEEREDIAKRVENIVVGTGALNWLANEIRARGASR